MLVTVDTGGTKTLIAGFSSHGKITTTVRIATPPNQDEYVKTVRHMLQEHFSKENVDAIAIALPGIIKDGVALWCNNLGWKNFDAQRAFQGVLGKAPVLIENDANLAGLSEARLLEPSPTSVLYVTISTGIGTGVITNRHIDPGLRHSEGGRSLVEFDGMVREWESFASGKAIHSSYGKYAREITSERTWLHIADRISRGFLAIIPFIQSDVVILGGSIGTYFDRYDSLLEGILREKLPPHIACPHFVQAQHPEKAVVYGCYHYATDYLADH